MGLHLNGHAVFFFSAKWCQEGVRGGGGGGGGGGDF